MNALVIPILIALPLVFGRRDACPPSTEFCSCERENRMKNVIDYYIRCKAVGMKYLSTFDRSDAPRHHFLTIRGFESVDIDELKHGQDLNTQSLRIDTDDEISGLVDGVISLYTPNLITLILHSTSSTGTSVNFDEGVLSFLRGLGRLEELKLEGMNKGREVRITDALFDGLGLESLKSLSLRFNKISWLSRDTFIGLPRLDVLDLSGNELSAIDYLSFPNLKSLRQLNLEGNKITQIADKSFLSLSALEILNLGTNAIEQLDSAVFSELEGCLSTLILNSNNLKAIPANAIRNLTQLKKLDVGRNQISSFTKGDFSGEYNLEILNIGENPIMSFTSDMFTGLYETLVSLGLRRTVLDDVGSFPTDAVRRFQKLTTLDISGGFMSRIPEYYFLGIPASVSRIIMNEMDISEVDPNAFKNLTFPLDVSLDTNSLTSLDFVLEMPPCTFNELNVVGNPLECDCALSDILYTHYVDKVDGFCFQRTRPSKKLTVGSEELSTLFLSKCNSTDLELQKCAVVTHTNSGPKHLCSYAMFLLLVLLSARVSKL